MNDESLKTIEQQIAGSFQLAAPSGLRTAVLGDVNKELRAARYDRIFARAAMLLLVAGVGINLLSAVASRRGEAVNNSASLRAPGALADTAAVVADVTDAATARAYARHLAAMAGGQLKESEAAAIDIAIEHRGVRSGRRGEG